MAWAVFQYTRKELNLAGETLASPLLLHEDTLDNALRIINNWRASHNYPLNTFQVGLRSNAKRIDPSCLVAQRIKRLSSIEAKLRRFKTMKLHQMQDIGGCRAIVHSVQHVEQLVELYRKSSIKHKLYKKDDYIKEPQSTGYRGVHLIYCYYSDKKTTYNDLKIEMQFRSPLQHAWATAVETVGTFVKQALKSSQGEAEWLRFFALMGTAIAVRERTPRIPDTPTKKTALVDEIRHYANQLDVARRLHAYGAAMKMLEQPGARNAHYFLLELDPEASEVKVTGFRFNEMELASRRYLETERSIAGKPGAEAVLVSVDSLESLNRAYPNYFLDTSAFINALNTVLK